MWVRPDKTLAGAGRATRGSAWPRAPWQQTCNVRITRGPVPGAGHVEPAGNRHAGAHPPPPRPRTTNDPGARDASSEGGHDDTANAALDDGGAEHRRDGADGRPGRRRPGECEPHA